MTLSYATATVDDVEEMCELDGRSFGFRMDDKEIEFVAENFDLSRFIVARDSAVDGNPIVATAGNFSLEVTLAGPAPVPMAGVTWVSVSATHRRRGIAAELMARVEDDARAHDDPIIGLTASEGGIYERFGYGVATVVRSFSIDRRRVEMLDEFKADTSTIRFVNYTEHYDEIGRLFDRFRRTMVGEVSMPDFLLRQNLRPPGPTTRMVCALHPDGFAVWQVNPDWNEGDPQHGIRLWMLVGLTDEAYRALWTLVLSTDLGGEISGRMPVGPDEPLPYFLSNPRALKTTHIGDHLWLKILDPNAVFSARSYRTDDALVLELANGDKFRVTSDGVSTARRRKKADLVLTESAVGPLALGGVTASVLAAGGRLQASSTEILERADAFFGVSPTPHFRGGF